MAFLVVACQPAVQLGVHLSVAIEAKAHFEILPDKPVHLPHLPVAIFAIETGSQVRPMVEFHMVGHIENPDPRHRYFRFQMPPFLQNLGVLRNDVLVAEETDAYGRDSGVGRTFPKRMAEAAVDLLDPRVNPVAEENRLNRADPPVREIIIEIDEPRKETDHDPEEGESPEGTVFFSSQSFHNGSQKAAKRGAQKRKRIIPTSPLPPAS